MKNHIRIKSPLDLDPLVGPCGTYWEPGLEFYPHEDKLQIEQVVSWVIAAWQGSLYAVTTGQRTGNFYKLGTQLRMGIKEAFTVVAEIPLGAAVLPHDWEDFANVTEKEDADDQIEYREYLRKMIPPLQFQTTP